METTNPYIDYLKPFVEDSFSLTKVDVLVAMMRMRSVKIEHEEPLNTVKELGQKIQSLLDKTDANKIDIELIEHLELERHIAIIYAFEGKVFLEAQYTKISDENGMSGVDVTNQMMAGNNADDAYLPFYKLENNKIIRESDQYNVYHATDDE